MIRPRRAIAAPCILEAILACPKLRPVSAGVEPVVAAVTALRE